MKRQKVKHGQARIPGYTEENDFAAELGVSPITGRKWRKRDNFAAWTQNGRKFYYSDQAKLAWLRSLEAKAQGGGMKKAAAPLRPAHASAT